MDAEPPSGTAALEKCLELFQRIAKDRGKTPLATLAEDLLLPRSTLYRMTGALERAGMIVRIKPGHFGIGLSLTENLAGLSAQAQLIEMSRPFLRRLAVACRATVHLGVMENDMVTYLVKVSSGIMVPAVSFTQENAQLEAYCSGIGKVLLAWLPEDERKRYLAGGPFVQLTARTITDPTRLAQMLHDVKTQKFARDEREIADHLYCLAVPLWPDRAKMTAAISISFGLLPEQKIEDEPYIIRLKACAAEIARKLGK